MTAPEPSAAPASLPASLPWIERLVALDTTSRDSNLPLIEVVEAELAAHGIPTARIPSDDGRKANLVATIPAGDGTRTGGIVLSGHTDVVPVDGQSWESMPFAAQVRDGRLYGRGTCDMKGFLGVVLAKVPDLLAEPLAMPVHLALSYDEEVGCLGADSLVKHLVETGLHPRFCLVGEPTMMRAIRAHKSINLFQVDFYGVAAHSSQITLGVNAIDYAARFVGVVREQALAWQREGPFDPDHEVPHSTCSVNLIEGGNAVNTVPAHARVTFEFRTIGADDVASVWRRFRAELDDLDAQMRAAHPAAHLQVSTLAMTPGLETPTDAPVVALAACLGVPLASAKVAYGTEAGLFDAAGIGTLVCGPGDIAQAHGPDEFVSLEQIRACEGFIDSVIAYARSSRSR